MANFFGKPKTSSARASPVQEPDLDPAGPSTSQSEFERTFKPFVVKKDAEIAPTNWFLNAKTNSAHRRQPTYNDNEIIIIDDDVSTRQDVIDVDMRDIQQESLRDVNKMGIQGQPTSFFSKIYYLPESIFRACCIRPFVLSFFCRSLFYYCPAS